MIAEEPVVLDASAVLELLLRGAGWETVQERALGGAAYAPDLLDVEVLHVLRRLWLRDRLTGPGVERALAVLEDLPLVRVPSAHVLRAAWRYRANLSAYDACYLAVAELVGGRLVTRDRALAGVPGSRVSVDVLPP